jgi:hypothetical protein
VVAGGVPPVSPVSVGRNTLLAAGVDGADYEAMDRLDAAAVERGVGRPGSEIDELNA